METKNVLSPARNELVDRWRARREEWSKFGAFVDGAAVAEEILADIAMLADYQTYLPVDIATASQVSGYSADHLRRLISQGKLRNAGRKGAPKVFISDLPRRIQRVAPASEKSYDPATDARFLRVRR
jgi:hypothetical protein